MRQGFGVDISRTVLGSTASSVDDSFLGLESQTLVGALHSVLTRRL